MSRGVLLFADNFNRINHSYDSYARDILPLARGIYHTTIASIIEVITATD